MKAPVLISIVVGLHVVAVSAIVVMQGCGTRGPMRVEPPPAPVMPPRQEIMAQPKPVFQPPVPVEHAPSMMESSASKVYQVQPGDSLSKIASRVGVSKREIIELNKIKDENKIRIGQKLFLPDYATAVPAPAAVAKPTVHKESAAKPAPAKSAKEVIGAGSVYVVQAGDSLSRIAGKHNTTLAALRETNKIKGDKILVGQKLTIPGAKKDSASKKAVEKEPPVTPSPAPVLEPAPAAPAMEEQPVPAPEAAPAAPTLAQDQPIPYTVQDGETIEDVAKIFIVRKEEIMKLNNLQPGETLKPGQTIKIPPSL